MKFLILFSPYYVVAGLPSMLVGWLQHLLVQYRVLRLVHPQLPGQQGARAVPHDQLQRRERRPLHPDRRRHQPVLQRSLPPPQRRGPPHHLLHVPRSDPPAALPRPPPARRGQPRLPHLPRPQHPRRHHGRLPPHRRLDLRHRLGPPPPWGSAVSAVFPAMPPGDRVRSGLVPPGDPL